MKAFLAILLFALPITAQAPIYRATPQQYAQLQRKQQQVRKAYATAQAAQFAYQTAVENMTAECNRVREENGWPSDVQCDGATLTFSVPTPRAEVPHSPPTPSIPEPK